MHAGVQSYLATGVGFQEFPGGTNQNSVVGVGGPIARQYLDDREAGFLRSK